MKGKIINLQLDDSFYKEETEMGTLLPKTEENMAVEMICLTSYLKYVRSMI